MAERLVRFSPQFLEHRDVLVPDERRADGAPHTDFLLDEPQRIRDQLANGFDDSIDVIGLHPTGPEDDDPSGDR